MSLILRVGAVNLPVAGDHVEVRKTGTTDLVTGLKTTALPGVTLPNPFTVPASGQYGFEPANTDRVDVFWVEQNVNIAIDVNVRDITLDLSDGAFKQFSFEAVNGEAVSLPNRTIVIVNPGDEKIYKLTEETSALIAGFTNGVTAIGGTALVIGGVGHILGGFTGLTPGAFYMASYTNPGEMEVYPVEDDDLVYLDAHRVVGQAFSTTELRVLNGLNLEPKIYDKIETFVHDVSPAEILAKEIVFATILRNEPNSATNFQAIFAGEGLSDGIDYNLSDQTKFSWDGLVLESNIVSGDSIGFSYTY